MARRFVVVASGCHSPLIRQRGYSYKNEPHSLILILGFSDPVFSIGLGSRCSNPHNDESFAPLCRQHAKKVLGSCQPKIIGIVAPFSLTCNPVFSIVSNKKQDLTTD
jgi:hypothetical protein